MRQMQITPWKPCTETLVLRIRNQNRGTITGTLELQEPRLQYRNRDRPEKSGPYQQKLSIPYLFSKKIEPNNYRVFVFNQSSQSSFSTNQTYGGKTPRHHIIDVRQGETISQTCLMLNQSENPFFVSLWILRVCITHPINIFGLNF